MKSRSPPAFTSDAELGASRRLSPPPQWKGWQKNKADSECGLLQCAARMRRLNPPGPPIFAGFPATHTTSSPPGHFLPDAPLEKLNSVQGTEAPNSSVRRSQAAPLPPLLGKGARELVMTVHCRQMPWVSAKPLQFLICRSVPQRVEEGFLLSY